MQTTNLSGKENFTDSSPSRADLSSLFFHLADAYLVLDSSQRVVFANLSYLRLLGLALDDIVNKPVGQLEQFAAFFSTPDGAMWMKEVFCESELGDTKRSPYFRFDLSHEEAARRERFWRLKATVVPTVCAADGDFFVAVRVSDVTVRAERDTASKRETARLRSQAQLRNIVASEAAEQLRSSREQLDVALAFAKVGAWELDPVTGIIACTPQCKVNLGLNADELLTEERLFSKIIAVDDREGVRARMERALNAHQHFEAEYRLEHNVGETRWLLVRGQGKYRENGSLASILGFTIDITARKETELRFASEAMQERDAREQSDRNVLAMDQFVSAVTHELRSPLSAITSWAELLDRTQDPTHLQQAASSLKRNARQLHLMVDDLLDTGAIVSGKLSVHRRPVDLNVLAHDVVSDLAWDAQRKGLSINSEWEPCSVLGDEARLKQVVWNLMSNAIKFTDQGAIFVSVRHDANMAILSVEDTGCGIAPHVVSRVFDRFEQARSDVAGRIGGLGLGLWLVKNLIEMHKGTVEVLSRGIGEGTTFRVHLPLLDSEPLTRGT